MARALLPVVVASLVLGCGGKDAPGPAKDAEAEVDAPKEAASEPAATDLKKPAPPSHGATPAEAEPSAAEAGSGGALAAPAAPAPTLPEGPGTPSPWPASVKTTITIDAKTELQVAAQSELADDPGKSRLWAQAFDDAGAPTGPAVELRKTNGEVETIAAAFDGVTLWVSWQSRVSEDGRGIQGLAGYDLSLRQTIKTKNLRFFRFGGDGEDPLQMVARPGTGAGVTVIALAGTVRCEGMHFEEEGMTDCAQLAIDLVAPDGTVQLTETSVLDGGEPSVTLTEGEGGLDVEFLVWHGGALTDNIYVSYSAESRHLSTCTFPPALMAWIDGGLLSLCRDPDLTEDEIELSCRPENIGACGTFYFTRPEGGKGTSAIPQDEEINFDRLTLGCKGNVPTVRVGWKTDHFDMPAAAMGFKGADAVMSGGKCEGKALP